MIVLWILLAFIAGAMFWHKAGWWAVGKVFGSKRWQPLKRDIVGNLSDEFLLRLAADTANEVARRRALLGKKVEE